jgi:hypothetical protein
MRKRKVDLQRFCSEHLEGGTADNVYSDQLYRRAVEAQRRRKDRRDATALYATEASEKEAA